MNGALGASVTAWQRSKSGSLLDLCWEGEGGATVYSVLFPGGEILLCKHFLSCEVAFLVLG